MFAVFLATLSSVSYGASDFAGAVSSRRTDPLVVTLVAQLVSAVTLAVVLLVVPAESWSARDLAWGAGAGLCAALALVCLYQALAIGPLSTATATMALVAALVPLVAGLMLGERPRAITLVGVAISVPATVLVSVGGAGRRTSLRLTPRERWVVREREARTMALAVLAGLGFGLFFVLLSRTSAEAGLFPLVGVRAASITVLAFVVWGGRTWGAPHRSSWILIVLAGVLDFAANAFFVTALDRGQLTWVAAITSLYPVTTIVLAAVVLRDKIETMQRLGLSLAGVSLTLVAIGH